MSKIFEAYKKKVGTDTDLSIEISRAGSISLYNSPDASQKNEFNQLANRLLGYRVEPRGALLAFASTSPGEGSSFVSYNTAVYLSTVYHKQVAWIDANFLSPQKQLMHQDGPDLSSLLQHPSGLQDLTPTGNLTLIPGGSNLAQNRGLFAHQKCRDLLMGLTQRFDFVLIDLPPVLNTSDTALIASLTDGMMLVIRQRFLKREIVSHGIEGLRAKSVNVLGAVINKRTYDLPKVIYDRL